MGYRCCFICRILQGLYFFYSLLLPLWILSHGFWFCGDWCLFSPWFSDWICVFCVMVKLDLCCFVVWVTSFSKNRTRWMRYIDIPFVNVLQFYSIIRVCIIHIFLILSSLGFNPKFLSYYSMIYSFTGAWDWNQS